MTSALDYFTRLPKYRVVLCKICHYCVWPDNARTRKETGAAKNETPSYSKHEASIKKKILQGMGIVVEISLEKPDLGEEARLYINGRTTTKAGSNATARKATNDHSGQGSEENMQGRTGMVYRSLLGQHAGSRNARR